MFNEREASSDRCECRLPSSPVGCATQVGSYGLLVDEYEVHTNFDGRDGDDEIQVSATVLPLPPFLCTLLFVYFLHVEWNQQPGSSFNASSGFELSLFTPSKQVSAHLSRIQFVQEAIQGLTETLHLFTASRPRATRRPRGTMPRPRGPTPDHA